MVVDLSCRYPPPSTFSGLWFDQNQIPEKAWEGFSTLHNTDWLTERVKAETVGEKTGQSGAEFS